jgi:hypothetical protein
MRNGRINRLLAAKTDVLRNFQAVYQNDGSGAGAGAGSGSGEGGNGGGEGGSGSGSGGSGGSGSGGSGSGGSGSGGSGNQTFTQDQLNKYLAEEKRKWQNTQKDLVSQLEQIKQTATLTQQQRDELQQQIDAITAQYTTKEEQAKQEREKLEKTWNKKEKELASERDQWKSQYSSLYIDIEIRKAATKNNAYSEDQMVDYLGPRAKLSPEVGEDGKPTGKFVPTITFQDADKDGKSITLELSIPDAIKRMKELPERFGNFFKAEGSGGIGSHNRPGVPGNALASGFDPKWTPEQYREWRKKRKEAGQM